jgi:hypothetical protein
MKFFKFSKTGWLILSAGVFVVVLGSLGITRTQQLHEQNKLDEELHNSTQLLEKLQAQDLQQQLDDLQQKVEEAEILRDEAAQRLDQTVISVDVSDELFDIAKYCGVVVRNLTTTPIRSSPYKGIGLDLTSLHVSAEGDVSDLVDFVMSLRNDYTTGLVESFQLNIPLADSETETAKVSVQILIYSYEGNNNG